MLSFQILWFLSNRPMYGQELATEIGKRRGEKPNPGTIYPALKDLAGRGLIAPSPKGHKTVYELTDRGRSALRRATEYFKRAFGEIFDSTLSMPKAE